MMNAGRKRPAETYPPHPPQAMPRTRKTPTDKTLPKSMEELHPEESKLYNQLREAEARIDATILRKRFDLLDALNRPLKCQKKIRISLSSSTSDQPWQSTPPLDTLAYDFDTDQIPSWTFTLRGQLLPSDPPTPVLPMTAYFKRIIIDFDRASDAYAEPNRVEWHKTNDPNQKMYDYIQCTRKGDTDVNVKVSLTVDTTPERYKLFDEFADILQIKEDTRPGIVMALWQYIKFHNLQTVDEKRFINLDAKLQKLFGPMAQDGRIYFPSIPEMMNRFLDSAEPVVLHYVVKVDKVSASLPPQYYDIDLLLDHPIRNRMHNLVNTTAPNVNPPPPAVMQIANLDEPIARTIAQLKLNCEKVRFLRGFSEQPTIVMKRWVEQQQRSLEHILANEELEEESGEESEEEVLEEVDEDEFAKTIAGLQTTLSRQRRRKKWSGPEVDEAVGLFLAQPLDSGGVAGHIR